MTKLIEKKALESTFLTVKNRITNNIELVASPAKFQVGLLNSPADLTVFGRTALSTKKYVFDKSHAVRIENHVTISGLIVNVIGLVPRPTFVSAYLPNNPISGQIAIIKDYSGESSLIPIRVFDPSGTDIDGSSFQVINVNYKSLTFVWNDSWFVIN
jgi:hypothetical protein